MISGVAKRMAGQFFKAIDNELTGVAVPAVAAAPAAAGEPALVGAPAAAGPQVFTGKAAAAAGPLGGDTQTLLLGAGVGALLTLIGILVGYRLGRR